MEKKKTQVFTTTLIAALNQVPKSEWMGPNTTGYVARQPIPKHDSNQHVHSATGFNFSYPESRRPSAPDMENQPYCLRDIMNSNPFAIIKRNK